MYPYQVIGIIACCTLVFAGVVTFLTIQGVHVLLALVGIYLLVVLFMLAMQRGARESFEQRQYQRLERTPQSQVFHARDFHSTEHAESVSEHANSQRSGLW